jgi:hypothetical protein
MNGTADEPESHTIRLLREMREEIKQGFTESGNRLDSMDHRLDSMDQRLTEIEVSLAAARADQTRANGLLETVADVQKNQGARLNVIEGRLALIEKHTGMVNA